MKAGIIGGTGKMGTLFSRVFSRAGYEVQVCGRRSPSRCRDIAADCSILVISVPIRETVPVIRGIAPLLREDQILCDLTSLKTGPVEAMLASRALVIGLHPMFGPTVSSLHGQTIIATPARIDDESLASFLSIFEQEGARITLSTPEEHDRMMAVVQGLTHFVTLTVAETMRRLDMSPEATEPFRSPVYQMEMGLVGRLLSQDPDMYGDMLRENPYIPPVLAACHESLGYIQRAVGDPESGVFREIFLENARYFGGYSQKAAEETDFLIDAMVRR
ncbi:MAG: prephenate dehydrogenase/arogenate dehydrogenase family protein [Methanoregulaceae archaeon]|nr:prephenate dehydrogenase/arogenate dehydrogenase family protein [Methanoregulaceae archaeon]